MLWQDLATLTENLSSCDGAFWVAILARSASTYLPTKPHSCQNTSVWGPVHIYESYIYTHTQTHAHNDAPLKIWETPSDRKLKSRAAKREMTFSLAWCLIHFSLGLMHITGEKSGLRGLRWYLLALCVVILDQVLEEVHPFLGLDLIDFDQVLQDKERCRVQQRVEIHIASIVFHVAMLLGRERRLCFAVWTLCIMLITSGWVPLEAFHVRARTALILWEWGQDWETQKTPCSIREYHRSALI